MHRNLSNEFLTEQSKLHNCTKRQGTNRCTQGECKTILSSSIGKLIFWEVGSKCTLLGLEEKQCDTIATIFTIQLFIWKSIMLRVTLSDVWKRHKCGWGGLMQSPKTFWAIILIKKLVPITFRKFTPPFLFSMFLCPWIEKYYVTVYDLTWRKRYKRKKLNTTFICCFFTESLLKQHMHKAEDDNKKGDKEQLSDVKHNIFLIMTKKFLNDDVKICVILSNARQFANLEMAEF